MARLFLIICLALIQTTSACAQTADRVAVAFANWAYDHDIEEAVLTLWHKGKFQRNVVIGEGAADRPVELASLSKAITAVCVARMMQQGIWRAGTTSFEVLRYGAKGVTVAQLLTHASGLGPDQTQVLMPLWLGAKGDRSARAAQGALKRARQTAQPGRFAYNNENYAILGAMITAQMGEPYEEYCRRQVLVPPGALPATPSAASGSFLPFGGWQMSVQDYAAFMWHGYGPGGVVGQTLGRWPQTQVEGATSYGMGMFQRIVGETLNFWHFGALCLPGRLNKGSYGVIWQGAWQIVAAYDICPTWEQMAQLDRAMGRAVFDR